jgi:phosphoribosylanthranilate isomerase
MAVKLKICGLMRPEDAAAAAAAGASYLGVVFAGGPRAVIEAQAREIVAAAAGVPVLGVFVRQSVEDILQIREQAGLSGAQLHGPYANSDARRLRSAGLQVWRVVRIAAPADLDLVAPAIADSEAVLVEPWVADALGGSGISLDLAIAREARARLAGHPMALAGGLTPDTVTEALAVIRPEIVDVSSGVERRPGVKDPNKIRDFVEAVFAHSQIT